jgi:hypothetical protein
MLFQSFFSYDQVIEEEIGNFSFVFLFCHIWDFSIVNSD